MGRKRIKQRWLRILEACQGPRLAETYETNPQFQKDLEREAALGDKHFGAALLTTEMLTAFRASIDLQLEAGVEPVVIVPGNLSSTLDDTKSGRAIWLNPPNLAGKGILDLQLAPYDGQERDANPNVLIEPASAFRSLYHTLDVNLRASGFTTKVHPYDWRKDVDHKSSAQRLKKRILALHRQSRRPVHIVAHSLGAMVARRAVQFLCEEQGMPAVTNIVGRLVLLGPSVSGTFAGALGLAAAVRELPFFALLPPPSRYVQPTARTWTTLYQLLPWDDTLLPSLKTEDVRKLSFWRGRRPVDTARFRRAFPENGTPWAAQIDTQFFRERTAVILGYHPLCPTASEVHWSGKKLKARHSANMLGDGFMLHVCSVLPDTIAYLASGVDHIRLPMAPCVINAVIRILHGEADVGLPVYG
jgi:pimeloyl-ACP methyl ester carboxylesterase